jgi:hypothetical protein
MMTAIVTAAMARFRNVRRSPRHESLLVSSSAEGIGDDRDDAAYQRRSSASSSA